MKQLKIYFTSDLHGYIFPTDYRDETDKHLGLLKIASNFEKDGNTLILDGGDTIQGSPMMTYLCRFEQQIHPMATILNDVGYDFVTIGNHEFNYGFDYLKSYLNHLKPTCLCANIIDKTSTLNIEPYAIKMLQNGLKVGVIGFTTDFIPIWEKPSNIVNIQVLETFSTVKKIHDNLRDKVDILIGLYHGGFERDIITGNLLSVITENIGYKICEELSFDLLLTGHQHMNISPTLINKTYIVQPGHYANSYVKLDIEINEANKIANVIGGLYPAGDTINTKLYETLLPLENEVQKWLDIPVGHLDVALEPTSHLQMALNGTYLANFINQVQLDYTGADISTTSFANSIKGFNKSVTIRDIVSTYVFSNTLKVLEVSGTVLKLALEACARYFEIEDGQVVISKYFTYPKVCHYNYDYFSGIDYVFDLRNSVGSRVTSIKFKGQKVSPDQTFTLAMNNYRATGVGDFEFYCNCKVIKDILIEIPEIIIEYFHKHQQVVVDKTKYYQVIA